jgi:hypothetical protein
MLIAPSIDLTGVASVAELRSALHPDLQAKRAQWVSLNGLSATEATHHQALLRILNQLGLGGDEPQARAGTVVLDWSTTRSCSADGLAFFAVVMRVLREAGFHVVLCEPSDGDIALALDQSGLRSACKGLTWIPSSGSTTRRITAVTSAALFGGALGGGNVQEFSWKLDDALDQIGLSQRRAGLLSAVTTDLVQNVLAHAGGVNASVVALLHTRRRPPVVEIGVADAGLGIAASLLSQERHAWLMPMTDAAVAEVVFGRALSGRSAEAGGGGLSRLVRRLRDQCDATVLVRTGAALLDLSGPTSVKCTPQRLNCGWGTQVLVAVRVAP